MKIWLDGKMVDAGSASVNVYDHGLLYGDGVFEGLRAYSGTIFMVAAHVDRLFHSARAIRLEIPYDKQTITDAMYETLRQNGLADGYIRLVVTRGCGTLGLNPFKCSKASVFIITDQIEMYSRKMYDEGMSVIVASTVRNAPNAISPRIKSLNYLNNILARIEAVDAGVAEAIMLNTSGLVCEATGDNIFVVREGTVVTPPVNAGILAGVTRAAVMGLARKSNIPMVEADVSRYDLYTADECFLTGTAAEVIGVTHIDGRTIGSGEVGPITRRITEDFHALVRQAK